MNTANNYSTHGADTRSVQRIIVEKASFGATPVAFTLQGTTALHPVQWTRHPNLESIHFSDGSIIYVTNGEPGPEVAGVDVDVSDIADMAMADVKQEQVAEIQKPESDVDDGMPTSWLDKKPAAPENPTVPLTTAQASTRLADLATTMAHLHERHETERKG